MCAMCAICFPSYSMRPKVEQEQNEALTSALRQVRELELNRVERTVSALEEISAAIVQAVKQAVRAEVRSLPSSSDSGLLLKKELADRLQISVSTVSKMQSEGLPTIQFGKSVRFDYEEALAWVKSRRDLGRGERKLRMVA